MGRLRANFVHILIGAESRLHIEPQIRWREETINRAFNTSYKKFTVGKILVALETKKPVICGTKKPAILGTKKPAILGTKKAGYIRDNHVFKAGYIWDKKAGYIRDALYVYLSHY